MEEKSKSKPSKRSSNVEVVAVQPVEEQSSLIQVANTPDKLIAMALQSGNVDITALERLMDLQERWLKRIAHEKFRDAMAKFQADVPEIKKSKKVSFTNSKGNTTEYNYAPLSEIEKTIKPFMAKYGLSKDFKFENFLDENKKEKIRVTCFITHVAGHKEENSMTSSADDSGSKNRIQQDGSAIEYMKRYTLSGALGLTTADDDDGQAVKNRKQPQVTKTAPSPDQYAKILQKVKTGETTLEKVKEHFDLLPVQEDEIKKATPVKKLDVNEETMKVLFKEVRGGVTIDEIKNRFAITDEQQKALEAIINSKPKQ